MLPHQTNRTMRLTAVTIAALSILQVGWARGEGLPKPLPPQPLADALEAFSKHSSLQLVYSADVARGLMSQGAGADQSDEETLRELLRDTGLMFEFVNERTVTVTRRGAAAPAPSALHSQTTGNIEGSEVKKSWFDRVRLAQQADTTQAEPPARSDSSSTDDKTVPALEEVIVTAERRAERAQRVPISMSVFSADFISQNFGDSYEVADLVPNYQVTQMDGFQGGKTTIRGLGSSDQANPLAATSILVYYDGIAAGTGSISNMPLWDLERIEVQRGPQGTLYGRNALAGAVQYFSAAPTDEFEAYGELNVGEFDLRQFEGAISGPITDNIKARLSSLIYERGGDVFNTFHHKQQGDKEWGGVRGILDWEISDNFDARVKVQYFEGDQDALFRRDAAPRDLTSTHNQSFLQAIGLSPNRQLDSNFEETQSALEDPVQTYELDLVEVDLNYDFGPIALTAIGGYVRGENFTNDDFAWPIAVEQLLFNEIAQWSGEVRLLSQTDHPFQWIAGAYYQQSKDAFEVDLDLTGLFRDLDGDGRTRHDADSPEDLLDGISPVIPGAGNLFFTSDNDQDLETHAVFLHTTFDWTDRLTTTHAVRYTREEKDMDFRFLSIFEFPVSFGVTAGSVAQHNDFVAFATANRDRELAVSIISDSNIIDANGNVVATRLTDSWEELTWRFAADFRLTDDALVYASASKGFRGGIFSVVADPQTARSADPETSIVYELGVKTQWFDRRLQFNAAGFYNDHTDYQTTVFIFPPEGGFFNALSNLPKTKVIGGEVELQAVLLENFVVAANVGLTDTEITEVEPGNEALLGNELPFAEDVNFSGFARYDIHAPIGTISPQVSWRCRGNYWSTKENNDLIKPGDFWTVDLRLGYKARGGNLYGMLYVKNIFDEVHPLASDQTELPFGNSWSPINERRNWGVTVGYRF